MNTRQIKYWLSRYCNRFMRNRRAKFFLLVATLGWLMTLALFLLHHPRTAVEGCIVYAGMFAVAILLGFMGGGS